MTEQEMVDDINKVIRGEKKYQTCMSLHPSEDGGCVELILDTGRTYFAEWIPGEGGDICLYRCRQTGKVVGCCLPLMNPRLLVFYDGPMKVNEGFEESAI